MHRDVYLSQELFDLEMERLWRNTWIYVGHDSQVPAAGDYYSTEIARQPVIMLRDEAGEVRVLMNRCAHKGARLVSAMSGHCEEEPAALPVPRLDLPPRRLDPHYPAQGRLRGHGACGHAQRARYRGAAARGELPRLRVRAAEPAGPDFHEYFGDSLTSIDNMVERSPEGSWRSPAAFYATCTTATGRCSSRT